MTRVLVTYASKHGSTAEVAAAITRTLTDCGLQAVCSDAGEVQGLEPYDAVVLGSAVYMKRWRREARRFLHHYAAGLAVRPLWVFSSGPVGDPANDKPGWSEPRDTIVIAEDLGVRDHHVFGGSLPSEGHSMARSMARSTPPEYRDRRDWDEIREWAQGIAAALASAPHRRAPGAPAACEPNLGAPLFTGA
jgi:menaquinone-dependent protoporphyrinogen oxidase